MHEMRFSRAPGVAAALRHPEIRSLAFFYCDTHALICKDRPENDLRTVIRTSYQLPYHTVPYRLNTVLMAACVEYVTDMKTTHTQQQVSFLCALSISVSLTLVPSAAFSHLSAG